MSQKCTARRTTDGKPCKRYAIEGGSVCPSHGGAFPAVQKRALVRAELASWGLGDTTLDPGDTLMRLHSQSAARAELYAGLLQEAFDAKQAEDLIAGSSGFRMPSGIAALIGHRFAVDNQGNRVPIQEAIRGLAELEAQERDRCANFAMKCVQAGLREREVRLAEEDAARMHKALMVALAFAGIAGEVRAMFIDKFASGLRQLTPDSGRVIVQ